MGLGAAMKQACYWTVVALAVASMSSVRAGPVLPNIGGLPHNFKAKDTMAKSLASMFLLKEGNVPSAQSALNVFSGVANANFQTNEGSSASSGSGSSSSSSGSSSSSSSDSPTTSILGGAVTIPATTIPQKLAALAPNFTEIAGAMHPDLSYFTDPSQNQFGDFFDFLTQSGTSVGSVSGPNFINSAPCLVGTALNGVTVAPSAVNIIPQLISVNPAGVGIFPEGINIQPAGLYISPYGVGVAPTGINIEPIVIGIAPLRRSVAPIAIGVTSSVISVTGPTSDSGGSSGGAAEPGNSGRRLLRKLLEGAGSGDQAAAGGDAAQKEQALADKQAAALQAARPEDVFLASYQNWISMASKMAMAGAGGDPQAASEFLADSLKMAGARLEAFQSVGDIFGLNLSNIYNVSHTVPAVNITDQIQKVTSTVKNFYLNQVVEDLLAGDFNITDYLPGGITFSDPVFFNDAAVNVSSTTSGFAVTSAFINYAPCIVANLATGVNVAPAGINIQPNGIYINPEGVNIQPQGINIQPTAIYIGPIADSITPTGILIAPEVIGINPVYDTVGDTGISVADTVISVPPSSP